MRSISQLIREMEAKILASEVRDEEWITRTAVRTGLSQEEVRAQHQRMVRIAQGSRYTIRQVETAVEGWMARGRSLAQAVDMVKRRVRPAPIPE